MRKLINIPNILTFIRIALLAPYMYLLESKNWVFLLFAMIIFLISGITDFLDGFLARKMGKESKFGKFFDPLADKIFIIASYMVLLVYHNNIIPLWGVILILIRELTISDFRLISFTSKTSSLNTAYFAKVKTALLFISIIVANMLIIIEAYFKGNMIIPNYILIIPTVIMVIAIYFAYHSGIVYLMGSLSENIDSKE